MTTPEIQALATELWNARQTGDQITTDQHPTDMATAYEILGEINRISGKSIVGYKLGATADFALELLKLDGPFAGPLLDACCHDSGHQAKVHSSQNPGIETEFVLTLGTDIPITGSVTESEVASAVASISGGFEIVSARFADMPTGRGLCTIADSAGTNQVITGKAYADWQQLDIAALPAALTVNGENTANGMSKDSIHGSPLGMLTWFANSGLVPERGLKAGDIVYCGTCTGLTPIKPGDQIEADFGVLGKVNTTIV